MGPVLSEGFRGCKKGNEDLPACRMTSYCEFLNQRKGGEGGEALELQSTEWIFSLMHI